MSPSNVTDVEGNKEIVRRSFEDGINKGDIDCHTGRSPPATSTSYNGRDLDVEAFKHVYEKFRAGFPDLNTIIEDIFAEGDKVAIRHTYGVPTTARTWGCGPPARRRW